MQEFYFQEVSKHTGSIHATYLITGERKILAVSDNERQGHDHDEDIHRQSSPFLSSSMSIETKAEGGDVCTVVSLVKEENLEGELNYLEKQRDIGIPYLYTKWIC